MSTQYQLHIGNEPIAVSADILGGGSFVGRFEVGFYPSSLITLFVPGTRVLAVAEQLETLAAKLRQHYADQQERQERALEHIPSEAELAPELPELGPTEEDSL